MSATVSFQRVTHQEVVVKITGQDGDSASVALATDLFPQAAINLVTSGTISTSDSSDAVTGVDTLFTQQLIGGKLYDGTDGPYLGTVESVASATSLTLTGNAEATYSGAFGVSYRTQELKTDVDPGVTIVSAVYTGTGIITVSRNSTVIMVLNAAAANGKIDLLTMMVPDPTEITEDIDVSFSDAGLDLGSQLWLRLRKIDGWNTRIEPAYYGSHDDETKVGS